MEDMENKNILSDSQKEIYEVVKKSWELDGYTLTDEDEKYMVNILKGKTTADEVIKQLLNKNKRGSDNDA